MQTLCECHERVCGVATDLDPGEDCSLGKTLACMGNDEPILVWQESSGERTRTTPEETQRPEEHGEAHRGEAELDQQRVQTHRDREREGGGDAGEYQSSERNSESSLRGDQETPSGLAARGRVDGQEQESLHVPGELGGSTKARTRRIELEKRNHFDETGSMDERRVNGALEVEQRRGKSKKAVEKESTMKDVKMSDDGMDGLHGSLSS